MSSLYTDPQWSTNTGAALNQLTQRGPRLDHIMDWVKTRSEHDHFSLSDLWGVLVSATLMKQVKVPSPTHHCMLYVLVLNVRT